MKNFFAKLKSDKALAAEYKEFLKSKNDTIKKGTKEVGDQLNKVVIASITEFAKSKGFDLKDDKEIAAQMGNFSKQICMQMNDMIVKQFEGVLNSSTR